MVWGAIWLNECGQPQRSPLVIMDRDHNAPRGGYTTQNYIEMLKQGLKLHWRPSQLFMHNNVPIHKARAMHDWLQHNQVQTVIWPPYSPDLNPIEHLWWCLKKRMYHFYPQYNNYSKAEEEWDGFCEALRDCWRCIPRAMIKQLISSMLQQIAACRQAHGWQTKY
jgi:transposase